MVDDDGADGRASALLTPVDLATGLRLQAGRVLIDGKDLWQYPHVLELKRWVGFCPTTTTSSPSSAGGRTSARMAGARR